MLERLKIHDFSKVYELMEMSFPSDEYRTYNEQKELLNNPAYSIYVLYNKSQKIKAFIAVWAFSTFSFIEHFAVNPEHRNKGIGTYLLSEVIKVLSKPVCLEVEPPETEMAIRRIAFYERNNFSLNEYPYMQPPISEGKKAILLFIMTLGGKVDEDTFRHIKATLYSKVYHYI